MLTLSWVKSFSLQNISAASQQITTEEAGDFKNTICLQARWKILASKNSVNNDIL